MHNEVGNSTRVKWWIPSKHLYWVYHYQLHVDGFEIHQLTFNEIEFMDMLRNDLALDMLYDDITKYVVLCSMIW
jgi:hypothetical protein